MKLTGHSGIFYEVLNQMGVLFLRKKDYFTGAPADDISHGPVYSRMYLIDEVQLVG